MAAGDAIKVWAALKELVSVGEVFDVIDLRTLVPQVEPRAVNAVVAQGSLRIPEGGGPGFADPPLERIAKGRYRLLRLHTPKWQDNTDHHHAQVLRPTCKRCFMALPSSGVCDCAE